MIFFKFCQAIHRTAIVLKTARQRESIKDRQARSPHTREYVPLLISKQGVRAVNIGVRKTMADTAVTAAEFFSAEKP